MTQQNYLDGPSIEMHAPAAADVLSVSFAFTCLLVAVSELMCEFLFGHCSSAERWEMIHLSMCQERQPESVVC